MKEKLLKIKANPRQISFGYALGVFLATTPFIGLKVFIALIVTTLFRWSKAASVVGVYHINILTAPLFYGFSFLIGKKVTGTQLDFRMPDRLSFTAVYDLFLGNVQVFLSLLAGGLILGIPMAITAYFFSMTILRKSIKNS